MWYNKDHKQIQDLQEENDKLVSMSQKLREENANYKRTIAAFVDVRTGYDNEVADLKQKHSLALASLQNELEAEKKSVNRKVNKALADIGVKEFAAEDVSHAITDTSIESIYSKFMSLAGEEKNKYFKANEQVLTKYTMQRQF